MTIHEKAIKSTFVDAGTSIVKLIVNKLQINDWWNRWEKVHETSYGQGHKNVSRNVSQAIEVEH